MVALSGQAVRAVKTNFAVLAPSPLACFAGAREQVAAAEADAGRVGAQTLRSKNKAKGGKEGGLMRLVPKSLKWTLKEHNQLLHSKKLATPKPRPSALPAAATSQPADALPALRARM